MTKGWFAFTGGSAIFGLLITAIVLLASCEKIDVGNVGLKVSLIGPPRGVAESPTVSGYVWYWPFTEQIVEFRTTVVSATWSKAVERDESISFASSEGLNVNADMSFAFHIDPAKAPKLYAKYRQPDLDDFAHSFLRNIVRDALNEEASKIGVQSIYGEGKSALLLAARRHLEQKLASDGIIIDQLTFNSAMRLPENVQQAIDASIAQTQVALRAENKVKEIEAVARQQVAQAEGAAKATRESAQAEADAILMRAKATAEANDLVQRSLTNSLIEYERTKKWDGKLPMFGASGNASTLLVDLRAAAGAK